MSELNNRQVAEIRNQSIDEENRTVTFVFSTDSIDRHGTVVNQDGWDLSEFERNPIIGYQHDVYGDMCAKPDPDDVIGRAQNMRVESMGDGKALVGEVQFEDAETNEKADRVFRKIQKGTLNMGSVGFMEMGQGQFGRTNDRGEVENPNTYYFEGQQLLEFSIVNIPSNPEAQSRSIRRSLNRALPYLKEVLGSKYSLSDIEEMKVGTVLKAADGESIEEDPGYNSEEETSDDGKAEEESKSSPYAEFDLDYAQKMLDLKRKSI